MAMMEVAQRLARMKSPENQFLKELFLGAVAAVEPGSLVRRALALTVSGDGISLSAGGERFLAGRESVRNVYVVGGGKAGRAMAEAAAEILGDRIARGAVAVPHGKGGATGRVRLIEAGHPFPDDGSREAAEEMLSILSAAGGEDLVVALLSGGGSAMISLPPDGVTLADKEEAARLLMRSGADIADVNTVRKRISMVKGGQMARAAHPARVLTLVLSDVPGDDPSVVASGPFSPDPATHGDAMKIVSGRGILGRLPASVRARIESANAGAVPETPKPGDPLFDRVESAVVGSNRNALEAAAALAAKRDGIAEVRILPGFLRGEARKCAAGFAAVLRKASESVPRGGVAVIIAGGETTVTVRGGGKGGRCQEFALSAAIELQGEKGVALLCAGTDGADGPTDAAGAFADGSTCGRAEAQGISPRRHLDDNDSYPFFRALSDLLFTGPTGTNVADIAVGLAGRLP